MRYLKWALPLILGGILLTAASDYTKDKLKLSYMGAQLSFSTFAVLKQAYKNIGIEMYGIQLPAKRALVESNAGNTDGEVHRIKFKPGQFPNLVRIEVPINHLEGVVLSIRDLQIDSAEDLTQYHLGIKSGHIYAEKLVQDIPNVTRMVYLDKLLQLLLSERVDGIIVDRVWAGDQIRNNPKSNLQIVSPTLVSVPLFHYLHKKNDAIIPKITEELQRMQQSGESDIIRDRALKTYIATGRI